MAEPLKDQFFHPGFIQSLSEALRGVHAKFDDQAFRAAVLDASWPARELKQRMRHISTMLHVHLPVDYARQIRILEKVAPQFPGFPAMIFPDFVEQFGLVHFDISVKALERFTPLCSSEFAVRPFLVRHEQPMLARMLEWTRHSDHHVRRLASEGCRPRLPWAMALPRFKEDPAPILPILEALRNDPSEYVRRSVANNLNDIAKDNPQVTLAIAGRWLGTTTEIDAIVKHACRTLLKAGDAEALALFGFRKHADAEILKLRGDRKSLAIGDTLAFSFSVCNPAADAVTLRLEYTIYFARPTGRQGKKIFQIAEREFPPGLTIVERRHSFQDRSIRKHHPGQHTLAVSVNGMEKSRLTFLLKSQV